MRKKLTATFCILLAAGAGLLLALSGCSKSETSPSAAAGAKAKTPRYHCPMHPTYVSDRPGDCPICGMRLVPIKEGEAATGAEHAGHEAASDSQTVPGRIAIRIAPEKRQIIGLTTSAVERRDLTHSLRTTATVVHDERRLARIAPRFGGWVRSLQVNYTGQPVEKGQPLFTVYSPELFTTESEYLLALRNSRLLTNSPAAEREAAQGLVDSARRRLELMQVGDEEIRALEQRAQPADELLIRAPFSGHVVTKMAVEGKAFMAGETLYEIADLHHLWLRASVFEYELPEIKVGQKAKVIFPNLNNKTFESAVSFIYPHIDPQTRRAEVRLELDNPNHELRPDMWANVEIQISLGQALTVPASAVLDTGERYLAFVDRPDEHLEPRELKIGARTDDYFQVLDGVKEGEKVVTRALFLVDSESQLKAAIAGMGAAGEHKH